MSVQRWSFALSFVVALAASVDAQVNIGAFGTATQSSDFGGGQFPASLGIDGDLGNFTHTAAGQFPATWQVAFDDEFAIEQIVLHNRDNCCQSRLRDVTVYILNEPLDVLDPIAIEEIDEDLIVFESDLLNELNEGFEYPGGPETLTVDVAGENGGAASGVAVVVQRTNDPFLDGSGGQGNADEADVLQLGEVEVFATVDDLPPRITLQPVSVRASAGGTATFVVEAIGSDPLTYQWEKNEETLDGATDPTLILTDLTMEDSGDYSVIVMNEVGQETSEVVTLTVTPPNLALCGVASQSTEGFGGAPGRAIDGNTSGVYPQGSVTHTATGDLMPWWEVSLIENATIEEIAIWNRTDCCVERLSNFAVVLLNDAREEVWSDEFFTDGTFPDTTIDPFIVEVDGVEARTVRIEKLDVIAGSEWLSLAEVEVFGGEAASCEVPEDPDLTGRPGVLVRQSSQLGGFIAENAIDDNFGNFTHTQAGVGLPATWEIDLLENFDIAEIILYNRTSCCGSRLRDITVFILDSWEDDAQVLWESELLNPENELGEFPTGPAELRLDIVELNGSPVSGRVVRVVREPDDDLSGSDGQGNNDEATVLQLGEVEIFELPDCPDAGSADDGDTHCSNLAIAGPDDEGPGDYTVTADGADDTDDLVQYTFTAVNQASGTTLTVGPQGVGSAVFALTLGTWDISAEVDDDLRCPDAADDMACATQTVEVIDPTCVEGEACNVAPKGVAGQSTTGFGGTADRAIDGNTDGTYNNGSVTHTAGDDPEPTWEVILDQSYDVERIVLWNRVDCCSARLTNFTVALLDAEDDETWSDEFFTDGFEFPDTAVDGFEIEVGAIGTRVRIQLLSDHAGFDPAQFFLSLAEVQVYGLPAGDPPGDEIRYGDTNNDGGVNIADAIFMLNNKFGDGGDPSCVETADVNADNSYNIADAIFLLNRLFGDGPPPIDGAGPDGDQCTALNPEGSLGCALYDKC